MSVSKRLIQFIEDKELLVKDARVVLAISGGKDSMLLATLFHDLKIDCIIAHCNFHLRAEESDKDEALVREYGKTLGFPVFVNHFDTEAYALENKVSIQMAARELRYAWFEELRQENNCQCIAVAQHANDHLETMLLNLTRSTGIQGLLGIQPKRGSIIRPILFLTADEVAAEVNNRQIPYRDDQSNFSTKYARNKIRLEIIPKFKEIQPEFESILAQNMKHFEESQQLIHKMLEKLRKELFRTEGKFVKVNLKDLKEHVSDSYLMFELFRPFHFQRNVLEDLGAVIDKGMGQLFESDTHEMLLDRVDLIIREKRKANFNEIVIPDLTEIPNIQGKSLYFIEDQEFSTNKDVNVVQLDQDLLQFPLLLRTWKQGDSFKPLGMSGSKKLSDYFIQQKLNRFEKDELPILVNSDGQVIWLLGMRLDNRFKVTENTKKVLTLVYK